MARTLGDILRRFRPTVAPGPPAPSGVPADRVAEVEAELAGVFAALEPTIVAARQRVEDAAAEADRRRQQAHADAQRILSDAAAEVEAARARAAGDSLAGLDAVRAVLADETDTEVARLAAIAASRRSGVVTKLIAEVWATGGVAAPGVTPDPLRERAG